MKRKKRMTAAAAIFLTIFLAAGSFIDAEADESGGSGTDLSLREDYRAKLEADFLDISDDMDYWPETRWWLAQAVNTDQTLIDGIQELYDEGFRSVEILQLSDDGISDNETYGWGSEAWKHDMRLLCEQLLEHNMGVGLTSGPAWMPAIEIDPNDDGALQDIDYVTIEIKAGETYTGEIPQAVPVSDVISRQSFVAAVATKETGSKEVTTVSTSPFGETTETTSTVTELSPETIDITDYVTVTSDENGNETAELNWTAQDEDYIIFAYWMYGSACAETSSYVTMYSINHFDRAGAEAQIEYWENYVFSDGLLEILEQIAEVANVDFFQDSLEIASSTGQFWSRNFLEEFVTRRGYDLTPYLPVVSSTAGSMTNSVYEVTDAEMSEKIMNDVYQTMTDLYQEYYLTPIKEWLNSYGFRLRAQVVYGKTMEVSTPVAFVDVPESETLAMENVLDGYRMQTGVAHLYNKNVFSSETGAVFFGSYCTSIQDYLYMMNSQFAAGINRTIFHGYASIAGPEDTTVWPGYDGGSKIGTIVSDRWGKRMPVYQDETDLTSYITRIQKVLQTGTENLDVLITNLEYDHQNLDGLVDTTLGSDQVGYYWEDLSMQAKGYSYEFASPQVLEDETVSYLNEDGTLGSPNYQALILGDDQLPLESAKAILELAKEGLPVILLADRNYADPSYADSESTEQIQAILDEMLMLDNVGLAENECDAVQVLEELGISPRIEDTSDTEQLLSVLRRDIDSQYIYLYNRSADTVDTEIVIEGEGIPYQLDPWTGSVTALANYSYDNGNIILPIDLKSMDTTVIILDMNSADYIHAENDASVIVKEGELSAVVNESGNYLIALSDGTAKEFTVSVPDEIVLGNWNLSVESWTAGEKQSVTDEWSTEYYYETIKTQIDVPESFDELIPWSEIESVGPEVSGIGTYTASFDLPDEWDFDQNGMTIDLGELYETASVIVNGVDLGAVNPVNAVVDISSELQRGENTIEISVTSTLGNAVSSISSFVSGGAEYGLQGVITLTPYTIVDLL